VESPVFHDPQGRRWRRVRRIWLALSVVVTGLAIIFIASVLANPVLPSLSLRPKPPNIPTNPSEHKAKKAQAELQRALATTRYIVPGKHRARVPLVPPPPSVPAPVVPTTRPLSVGFFINWDESSYESLKRNLDHLDWVIAMPNVWIFQIVFALISPVMDLMLIYVLISSALDRWQQPTGYSSTNLQQVLFYYALFLAIDWASACFAFLLERRERWSLLWWLFLQRFCYRQVMYYVMIKSVAMAIRGPVVGWGKLERKATVETGF
jgi:hypothetical protein